MTSTPTIDPERRRRPSLSAARYAVGYLICVAGLVGAALWGMGAYRGWIDRFQRERPRYAAERAIEALGAGRTGEARLQIELLARERPIYKGGILNPQVSEIYEGAVFRDRVTLYERLCARLLKAGMLDQARTVAWKALLEYHISSRPLEMIEPWEYASLSAAVNNDWHTAFESARILSAHGADRVRTPGQMDPIQQPENPEMFKEFSRNIPPFALQAMKLYYQDPAGAEWTGVINMLDRARGETANAAVANQLDAMLHQAFLKAGKPEQARQLLARKWGRDLDVMDTYWKTAPHAAPSLMDAREPSLMDYLWAERPADTKLTVANFVDSFQADPRVKVYGLSALMPLDIGYFNQNNKFHAIGDSLEMFSNVAGSMKIETGQHADQIAIAYQATGAIGIMPILLVRVDDGPYIPVYCDSTEPAIAMADIDMKAGAHTLSFIYLNDCIFEWPSKKIEEDRNLTLYRFSLIQVKRPG